MTRPILLFAAALFAGGCIIVDDGGFGRATYSECSYDSQCGGASDGCYDVTVDYGTHVASDGLCALWCVSDYDCPGNGACYSVSAGPRICYQRCNGDWNCPWGFACIDTIGGQPYDSICLPQ